MRIQIPYGSTSIPADIADNVALLSIREPAPALSRAIFRERLARKLQRLSLDLGDTVIVVTDKTRLCGYAVYLPILVEVLHDFGLDESRLRFIIGYGTHPRQTDDECLDCYGPIYNTHTFIHHDCRQKEIFAQCGTTSYGTPIRLRKDILDASSVITMGPICHHYFAGYGGGRKLIFPGCGEQQAIYANHGLYLDRGNLRLTPTCQPGILQGNPLAADLFEIADAREADLSVHGIMDSHGRLCDIVVGSGRKSYLEACKIHGRLCETAHEPSPYVIASCGGFPKDINFIQSHKAIHNGSMFVEDGGTLLVFSQCRDGIGSETFLPWFGMGGFDAAFARLQKDYQGNGGTALAMMDKTRRIRIILVTELDEDICRLIGVGKWSIDEALQYIEKLESRVSYIANSSLLVRRYDP